MAIGGDAKITFVWELGVIWRSLSLNEIMAIEGDAKITFVWKLGSIYKNHFR